MQSAGMEKIYRLTDNIMKVAYINLLTLFFTIIGLVVFGFFPALTATFGIFRKWLTGFSDIPVTKSYWAIYKKEFIRSNIIGGVLSFIGGLLYVNLSIAEVINQKWVHLSYYPILLVIILFLCTSLYVFPVYLHFNITILQTFKNAFLLLFFKPLYLVFMVAGIIILYLLITTIPGLIPFFSINLFALIVMFFSLKVFREIQLEAIDL